MKNTHQRTGWEPVIESTWAVVGRFGMIALAAIVIISLIADFIMPYLNNLQFLSAALGG